MELESSLPQKPQNMDPAQIGPTTVAPQRPMSAGQGVGGIPPRLMSLASAGGSPTTSKESQGPVSGDGLEARNYLYIKPVAAATRGVRMKA